jgi:hypothetical protein
VVQFQELEQDVADFTEAVRLYYSRFPLRDLLLSLGTLTGCSEAFARAETPGLRAQALDACRRGAAVIGVDLITPLPVPDILGEPVEEGEEPEEEEGGPSPETIDAIKERWKAVVDRISGWETPNSVNVAKFLDRFVQEAVEAFPDMDNLEDGLDSAISDVRQSLEAYQEAEPEDREDAWGEFVSGLADVDFSELGEE